MTADDIRTIGQIIGYAVVGAFIAWKVHRAEQRAGEAKDEAEQAKQFAEPTGNGFAKGVKDALVTLQEAAAEQKVATERIEARQQQDSGLLYSHIQAHANADVLKGTRYESPSDPNAP